MAFPVDAASPAPVVAPAPMPAPTPEIAAPAAPVAPAAPATAPTDGGSIKDVFSNLNWLEVGFGILGAAALFTVINYFRYSKRAGKIFENSIQNKVDDLNIKVSDVNSHAEAKKVMQPNDGFQGLL